MVAIVGPPNSGKSTLMNQFLRQKISIVTPKPQTTRNRIVGIINEEEFQIVFLDTPGLHQSREPLNMNMVQIAMDSLAEVDLVLFLIDVSLPLPKKLKGEKQAELVSYFEKIKSQAILVLNKIDLMDRIKILPMIEAYAGLYPFKAIVPVSALRNDGLDDLTKGNIRVLTVGAQAFP